VDQRPWDVNSRDFTFSRRCYAITVIWDVAPNNLVDRCWRLEDHAISALRKLKVVDDVAAITRPWETTRETINISVWVSLSYYTMKQHKSLFDESCSELLDHSKEAKMQWLQDPCQINRDNLKNVRPIASRLFGNHKREDIIIDSATHSKKKKLHDLSPRANYTDRATAASRRSVANLCG
jgi:hypothetical protein